MADALPKELTAFADTAGPHDSQFPPAPRDHAQRRFLDEAKLTGQLQHPGIPAAPFHQIQ